MLGHFRSLLSIYAQTISDFNSTNIALFPFLLLFPMLLSLYFRLFILFFFMWVCLSENRWVNFSSQYTTFGINIAQRREDFVLDQNRVVDLIPWTFETQVKFHRLKINRCRFCGRTNIPGAKTIVSIRSIWVGWTRRIKKWVRLRTPRLRLSHQLSMFKYCSITLLKYLPDFE